MRIQKITVTEAMTQWVTEGFAEHTQEATGYDGGISRFSFAAYDHDKIVGLIDAKLFCGQLHIRWLFVEASHRKLGVGKALMLEAFSYGREAGCSFAFVETMSFQGLPFYEKLGFVLEFSRSGFLKDTSLYYLKKSLI